MLFLWKFDVARRFMQHLGTENTTVNLRSTFSNYFFCILAQISWQMGVSERLLQGIVGITKESPVGDVRYLLVNPLD